MVASVMGFRRGFLAFDALVRRRLLFRSRYAGLAPAGEPRHGAQRETGSTVSL